MAQKISDARLKLVRSLANLGHGHIPRLEVENGQPIGLGRVPAFKRQRLDQPLSINHTNTCELKLKRHHYALFQFLDEIENGAITIKVQDGLPVSFAQIEADP